LPIVFYLALGKELFYRVPEINTRQTTWHSAKNRIPVVRGPEPWCLPRGICDSGGRPHAAVDVKASRLFQFWLLMTTHYN
jgi:hypothetical protein